MKLLRFGPAGQERQGILDGSGQIRDLSGIAGDPGSNPPSNALIEAYGELDPENLPLAPAGARIGPCVGRVGKLVAVGLNYRCHAEEAGLPIPEEPILFLKAPSAICGPFDDIAIPRAARAVDWEVELGVVIGRRATYVGVDRALNHVAGYCLCNDISERVFQLDRSGQWTKGKSADTFAPIGPWLVTCDEIADPQDLELWLNVNDQRYQAASTSRMVFSVAEVISYTSQFMTLLSGDVILTGTPAGIGAAQKPPVFLEPGDELRFGIDGLGEQLHSVTGEAAAGSAEAH